MRWTKNLCVPYTTIVRFYSKCSIENFVFLYRLFSVENMTYASQFKEKIWNDIDIRKAFFTHLHKINVTFYSVRHRSRHNSISFLVSFSSNISNISYSLNRSKTAGLPSPNLWYIRFSVCKKQLDFYFCNSIYGGTSWSLK